MVQLIGSLSGVCITIHTPALLIARENAVHTHSVLMCLITVTDRSDALMTFLWRIVANTVRSIHSIVEMFEMVPIHVFLRGHLPVNVVDVRWQLVGVLLGVSLRMVDHSAVDVHMVWHWVHQVGVTIVEELCRADCG